MTTTTKTRILGLFGLAGIAIFFVIRWQMRPAIDYKVIEINNAWGYEILVDDQVVIHQETIPAIYSLMGFPTKEDAEKTARFLIKKIQRKETPRLTLTELEELGLPLNNKHIP